MDICQSPLTEGLCSRNGLEAFAKQIFPPLQVVLVRVWVLEWMCLTTHTSITRTHAHTHTLPRGVVGRQKIETSHYTTLIWAALQRVVSDGSESTRVDSRIQPSESPSGRETTSELLCAISLSVSPSQLTDHLSPYYVRPNTGSHHREQPFRLII